MAEVPLVSSCSLRGIVPCGKAPPSARLQATVDRISGILPFCEVDRFRDPFCLPPSSAPLEQAQILTLGIFLTVPSIRFCRRIGGKESYAVHNLPTAIFRTFS
jgi:hypothetical protein